MRTETDSLITLGRRHPAKQFHFRDAEFQFVMT
jgi:hypothetical protein